MDSFTFYKTAVFLLSLSMILSSMGMMNMKAKKTPAPPRMCQMSCLEQGREETGKRYEKLTCRRSPENSKAALTRVILQVSSIFLKNHTYATPKNVIAQTERNKIIESNFVK